MVTAQPKKTPPQPPLVSGQSGEGKVPVLAAGSNNTTPTSSSDSGGSNSPMFSPLDMKNPDLIVVKAIYNIVG